MQGASNTLVLYQPDFDDLRDSWYGHKTLPREPSILDDDSSDTDEQEHGFDVAAVYQVVLCAKESKLLFCCIRCGSCSLPSLDWMYCSLCQPDYGVSRCHFASDHSHTTYLSQRYCLLPLKLLPGGDQFAEWANTSCCLQCADEYIGHDMDTWKLARSILDNANLQDWSGFAFGDRNIE